MNSFVRVTSYIKKFSFLMLLLFISSCGFSGKGKILKRGECSGGSEPWYGKNESQQQYLVNTSKSKVITFTLKMTNTMRIDNWENKIYHIVTKTETETHTLNPGKEVELMCAKYFHRTDDEKWDSYEYEIVGAVVEKR